MLESEHRNFDIRQMLKTQLIIAVPAESASAEVNKSGNGDDKVTESELAVSKVDEKNERGADASGGVGDHENIENEVIFFEFWRACKSSLVLSSLVFHLLRPKRLWYMIT